MVRLQRRLWLIQLLFWPTMIVGAVLAVAAAWSVWQRKTQPRAVPSAAPADRPEQGTVAG